VIEDVPHAAEFHLTLLKIRGGKCGAVTECIGGREITLRVIDLRFGCRRDIIVDPLNIGDIRLLLLQEESNRTISSFDKKRAGAKGPSEEMNISSHHFK
jgi:hypothetical protein